MSHIHIPEKQIEPNAPFHAAPLAGKGGHFLALLLEKLSVFELEMQELKMLLENLGKEVKAAGKLTPEFLSLLNGGIRTF